MSKRLCSNFFVFFFFYYSGILFTVFLFTFLFFFLSLSLSQESRRADGSFYNDKESKFVVELVSHLLEAGVPTTEIGVIALYKAQAAVIANELRVSMYTL